MKGKKSPRRCQPLKKCVSQAIDKGAHHTIVVLWGAPGLVRRQRRRMQLWVSNGEGLKEQRKQAGVDDFSSW